MKNTKKGPFARLSVSLPTEVVVETTGSGTVCVKVKTPGPMDACTLASFFYTDWPESGKARAEMLRRMPVLPRNTTLTRRLVTLVTKAVESQKRRRHEFGVPVSELPRNFSGELRKTVCGIAAELNRRMGYSVGKVTPASTAVAGAEQTLEVGVRARHVPVFSDRYGVFLGPPQDPSAPTVNWGEGETGRTYMRFASLKARPLVAAAITRRDLKDGTLWFAEPGRKGFASSYRPAVDLCYFVYLRKRFGSDLKFFRMCDREDQIVGVQFGGRWVGFIDCQARETTTAVERLIRSAVEGKAEGRRAA